MDLMITLRPWMAVPALLTLGYLALLVRNVRHYGLDSDDLVVITVIWVCVTAPTLITAWLA